MPTLLILEKVDHSRSPPITAGRGTGVRQVLDNHLLLLLVLCPPRPVRVPFQTEALLDRLLEHPRLALRLWVVATRSLGSGLGVKSLVLAR